MGARVIATAGGEAKAQRCRALGADHVILYKTQNVERAVRELAPTGVNVWWETLRQPDFEKAIGLLAPRGRMIVMAGRDARPAFPVGAFYTRDAAIHGFAMFNATPAEQAKCAGEINRWLADGRLKANIDRIWPLERAAEAHRLQEESTVGGQGALSGKIVLRP
jgi:NADPH2:quinone reductase